MSLKIKKHAILLFLVMLMFIIVPMSFASDVNDDGYVSMSGDVADISISPDNVNEIISISVETGNISNVENNLLTSSNEDMLSAYDGIIYVSTSGKDTNDGSEGSPVKTISKGISLATSSSNVAHKVIIGSGTYKENKALSVSSDLTIVGNNATINAPSSTMIITTYYNTLEITGGNVEISGVTFANINTPALSINDFHAIKIQNANVLIDNCVFNNNAAREGPAIYATNTGTNTVVISNNVFKKQTASNNGIIYSSNSRINLSNNTMIDCSSKDIYVSGGKILSELFLNMGEDTTIYLGDNVDIKATLTDDKGNTISGGNINVTANGVSIGNPAVSKGTASVNFVPADPENYTISGTYSLADNVNVDNARIVVNKLDYNGTIYVSKNGSDRNKGSQDQPVLTMAKAIELATSETNVDHKIVIGEGTYNENSLSISSDLTIVGNNTIISAENTGKNIFDITGGNISVSGVTFANVKTPTLDLLNDYHAIKIQNAGVTIDNCVFENNTAKSGPAIYVTNTGSNTVVITNNLFKEQTDSTLLGGGIIYLSNSRGSLSNNTIVDSTSKDIRLNGGEILSELKLGIEKNSTIYLGDSVDIKATLTDDNGNTIDGGGLTLTANGETFSESSVSSGTVSATFTPAVTGDYLISGVYSLGNNVIVNTALIVVKEYTGIIYVSKKGNDSNPGTQDAPVLTIGKAIGRATSQSNVDHKIIIDNGTYEENSLSISSDLTIVGNNTIIDAENTGKNIFDITGGNISVSGVTFANVKTPILDLLNDYHAIKIQNAGVTIDNCVFENNTAKSGPAIYITNTGSNTVAITNNLFKKQTDSTLLGGGIIYLSNSRGSLSNNTIVDSTSKDIRLNGGEILSELNLDIKDNTTIYLGDSVDIKATLTDDNGNTIDGGSLTLTANGETFSESSVSSGTVSATFTPDDVENYTISGVYSLGNNVIVNTALIVVKEYTGVIYVSKDGNDSNSGSEDSPVLTIEKAIGRATSKNNVEHKIIIDNGTYNEKGLVVSSDLTIIGNNTIIDASNTGILPNNILEINGGNVSVSGVTFANLNTILNYPAVKIQNASAVIDNCVFENNTALMGAAISISDVGGKNTVVLSNNLFKKQTSISRGIIDSSNSMIFLSNNTMVDCNSYLWGSDIYINGGKFLSAVNLTIKENTTIREGEKVTLTAVLTDDNGNGINGGKITLTANGETIEEVDADGDVTAVFTPEEVGNYTISGTYSLAENVNVETALISVIESYKGVIYVSKEGSDDNDGSEESPVLTIEKAIELATFKRNLNHTIIIDSGTYKEDGLVVSSDLTIIGNNVIIDSADTILSGSTILDISGGNVSVSGVTFANVNKLIGAGAVKIENANVVIDNCAFENNTALTGAAIYVNNAGENNTVVITNSKFKKQTSLSMGIIYSSNSRIYLSNNSMVDCSSYLLGSDIYISGGEILSEVNLAIKENTTAYTGERVNIKAILTDDSGNTIIGGRLNLTANGDVFRELYVLTNNVSTYFIPEALGNFVISGSYNLASDLNVDTALIVVEEYTGVIYVSKRGSDINCGNKELPVLTIGKAIELATSKNNVEHKIIIDRGTYDERGLEINSDLTIVGNNAVIDASYGGSILEISGGNVSVSGVTFTNVFSILNNGAVRVQNANVVIDNCAFESNTGLTGAAIYASNVGGNNAVVITNNKFEKQTSLSMGVIYSSNSRIYLSNNAMVDCSSYLLGSDIYMSGGEILSEVKLNIEEDATIKLGDSVTITASLTDDSGNTIIGGRINLTANDKTIRELYVLNNNVSTVFTPETAGNYTISGTYSLADNVNVDTALIEVTKYCGIIYVSKEGSDSNDGSPEEPVLTVAKAIELATSEDNKYHTIIIDNGTYDERNLIITSDLTIIGNNTIIDASNRGSNILDIREGNVSVSGITFADVNTGLISISDYHVIKIQNANVLIDNCVFDNNVARNGPAIYVSNSGNNAVVITNNVFKRQTARNNGVIYSSDSVISLSNNTMVDCTSPVIYINGGEILSEVNLVIEGNATVVIGNPALITASLTDDSGNSIVGGKLSLTANGEIFDKVNVDDISVSAEFISKPIVANYTISGVYDLAKNINVQPAFIEVIDFIVIKVDDLTKYYGGPEDFVVTLRNSLDLPVFNKLVSITIDGVTYNKRTDEKGIASFDISLNCGEYEVITTVDDVDIDSTITVLTTVNATDINSEFRNVTYSATLIDTNGNYIKEGTSVKFTVGDIGYIGQVHGNKGLATVDLTLNSGKYVITVTNPVSGEEHTNNINVNAKDPSINVTSDEVMLGENATVTVYLPEDATGSVTIGNEVVPVVNGIASAVLTNLPVGNTTVPVIYSGNEKYNPIETQVNVTVNEAKSDIISAPDVTKYYHGPERFVVTVTDYQGKALSNKSVTIVINGASYARTTDEKGIASIALSLNSGVYNVTSTVDNMTINSVVTILSTVNGTDVVKVYRNGTQYYATFRDSEGKYLKEGTMVTFNINGVFYDRQVSGDKGLARLNLNLEQGNYVITAINPVTGENAANNITILSRLVENKDITKFYRNATQYTVKVIGDDGNAVGAGENVTFNINGVFYTRQTNENGIAQLNINLNPGNYIITAEYKQCLVANNIVVLPVLTAEDLVMKYGDGSKFAAKLVNGQGKPYANQKIEFNINGVYYYRYTDVEGIARLNINLMMGKYIITSSFDSAVISNTITIY